MKFKIFTVVVLFSLESGGILVGICFSFFFLLRLGGHRMLVEAMLDPLFRGGGVVLSRRLVSLQFCGLFGWKETKGCFSGNIVCTHNLSFCGFSFFICSFVFSMEVGFFTEMISFILDLPLINIARVMMNFSFPNL